MLGPNVLANSEGQGLHLPALPDGEVAVRVIYQIAETPLGPVLSRCGLLPDDDTRCWLDSEGERCSMSLHHMLERFVIERDGARHHDALVETEPRVVGIEVVAAGDGVGTCDCRYYPEPISRDASLLMAHESWSRWARTATTDVPPADVHAHIPTWEERRHIAAGGWVIKRGPSCR